MRALVLAAGAGTRLRPFTLDRPKPMVPIGGRPLLEHTIRLLKAHGVDEIAINLHHCPDVIPAYFGDGRRWGVRLFYSHENPILGTAGAARRLQHFLDRTFLVVYGDVLTDIDLGRFVRAHQSHAAIATLALQSVADPTNKGVVELGPDGMIVRFVEKPTPGTTTSSLVNLGIYVLEPTALDPIPPDTFFDFGYDLFPLLLRQGHRLAGWILDGYAIDVGTLESYAQAEADFQAGRVHLPDLG